jgi:hypothetical protein
LPDATSETDAATLIALVYEGRQLAEALRSENLEIDGDEEAAERFLILFSCPSRPRRPSGRSTATAQVREPTPSFVPRWLRKFHANGQRSPRKVWSRRDSNP